MHAFSGLELGHHVIPDETTILNFRHLLDRHEFTKAVFAAASDLLEARGALLRGGTIINATLIAASPSTKNEARKLDPEIRSSKKSNQWYFVLKAHIGIEAKSGLVHTTGVTARQNPRSDLCRSLEAEAFAEYSPTARSSSGSLICSGSLTSLAMLPT